MPVLVRENGMLIAGHGRLEAAKLEGITEVPTIVARGWSEAQCQAYAIADNKLTEAGEWSEELLRLELGDLQAAGFNLALTGFDQDELDRLLVVETELDGDPDDAPERPTEPISRPGDLWICGEHRVLCGDATSLADVEKALGGELADMCFTDSPYNVNYSTKDKKRGKSRPILNDALGEEFGVFLLDACVNILTVTKGAGVLVHVIIGARHVAEGIPRRRRKVVDLRDLGEEHLHAWAVRLPAPVRADPLRLEAGYRSLLVRRPRPWVMSGSSTSQQRMICTRR
jgi:hypothetical protein